MAYKPEPMPLCHRISLLMQMRRNRINAGEEKLPELTIQAAFGLIYKATKTQPFDHFGNVGEKNHRAFDKQMNKHT